MTFTSTFGLVAMLNLTSGNWLVISDDVMGGVSTGKIEATRNGIIFTGELSLENNGGFSSTRRLVQESPAWAGGLRMRARGDGRSYQVRLRHDRNFDGVSWRAVFETTEDWQEFELRFSEFEPVFRGYQVRDAGPVQADSISQVGLLVADKRPGPFRLEVESLEFIP